MDELQATLADLDRLTAQRTDLLTVLESRLFDQKMRNMMVPTQKPVADGNLGSDFGWRIDPITGRSALHTGLDFQADSGSPILAAAGGVVVVQEYHSAYGNMVEIDHGNDLVTRYAHASACASSRRVIWFGAGRRSPTSVRPGARPEPICISRCWYRACLRIRKSSCRPASSLAALQAPKSGRVRAPRPSASRAARRKCRAKVKSADWFLAGPHFAALVFGCGDPTSTSCLKKGLRCPVGP